MAMLLRRYECGVCGGKAVGTHFGAVSCAACTAFFRRSIADQKVYACTSRNCPLHYAHLGRSCKFCRFSRCLASGMLPHEVQSKRPYVSTKFAERPVFFYADGQVAPGNKSPLCQLLSARSHIMYYRNKRKKFDEMFWFRASLTSLRSSLKDEWLIFQLLINEYPIFEFAGNLMHTNGTNDEKWLIPSEWIQLSADSVILDMFLMFYLHEVMCTTLNNGGIQLDRLYLPNSTATDVSLEALTDFFTDYPPIKDPAGLARTSSAFFHFVVRTLSRSFQSFCLGDMECSALFYSSLAHTVPPHHRSLLSDHTRHTIFSDISKNMETEDFALRIGNILMHVSTMASGLQLFKEFLLMVELHGINWADPQAPDGQHLVFTK